jgi:hypothetical protein
MDDVTPTSPLAGLLTGMIAGLIIAAVVVATLWVVNRRRAVLAARTMATDDAVPARPRDLRASDPVDLRKAA